MRPDEGMVQYHSAAAPVPASIVEAEPGDQSRIHLTDQEPAVHESKDKACPKGQGQAAVLRCGLMGRHSRWLTLLLLVAWVILGPIGMAFGSCGAMMALCDGSPCGVVTALVATTPTVATPVPTADAPSISPQHPITVLHSALEPPPKTVRLSA